MARRQEVTLAVSIVCCAMVHRASAQESSDQPPIPAEVETESESSNAPDAPTVFKQLQGKIGVVGPDAFILLDENGNPQQVLGMSYEEFFAAWKKQQALKDETEDARRACTLDELEVAGTVFGNFAQLTAKFHFTLHTSEQVEAPLNLAGMILQHLPEAPRRTDGRYLDYSLDRGGWFVTLEGEPGETVQVELDLMALVQRDGNRASLRMLAPRALKSSLVLAFRNAIEKVVADEGVVLSAKPLAAGGMRVEATDLGGEFTLSWEDRRSDTTQLATVLSSKAQLFSTIDGRSIRTRARLTVESAGGPFREFKVRLPPGARHLPTGLKAPIESVTKDPAGAERPNGEREGKELQVRLTEDTQGPVILELETEQPIGVSEKQLPVELAGFRVEGAVRQDGEIGIYVEDPWQLRWELGENVEQASASDIDLSWLQNRDESDDVTTAMRFFRQPWSLQVRLSQRHRRVVATPSYLLTITPGEAQLRMQVDYEISGVRTFPASLPLKFAMEGWRVEQRVTHGFENIQETVRQDYDEQSDASYGEYASATATTDRPDIVLFLTRPLPAGQSAFELPLPYPNQDRQAIDTSDLRVEVDSSLLLTPDLEKTTGLAPQPIDESTHVEGGTLRGQRFRYRGFEPKLVFAASRKMRQQQILVDTKSRVEFLRDRVMVEQDLDYEVRHQMIKSVLLQAPEELIRSGDLKIELHSLGLAKDDQPTLEIPLDIPLDIFEELEQTELRVDLTHPRVGRFRIRVQYYLAPPEIPTGGTFILPLVISAEGELKRHEVSLRSTSGPIWSPVAESSWHVEQRGVEGSDSIRLSTPEPTNFLTLASGDTATSQTNLNIERIWVQTWLTRPLIQQRTVFQFMGGGPVVLIETPPGLSDDEQIEITLDGSALTKVAVKQGQLEIPVPDNTPKSRHTLELRYRQDHRLGWTELLRLERPRLAGNEVHAEVDWQIISPVKYAFVGASDGLVKEFHSMWSSDQWRAVADRSTADLEQQMGAVRRMAPTRGEQAFLFRTLDPAAPLQATLIRRELLVLAVSAVVLPICLALWYVPLLRRPPVLLVGLAMAAIAGLSYPDTTVTVAQAGLLGGACGLVGGLLWLLVRRSQPPQVTAQEGPASSVISTGTRESTVLRLGTGAVSSNAPTIAVEMTDSNR